MLDWKDKVQFLRDNPRYNNAELFGVRIEPKENSNWVVSVYRLKDGEGRPNYSILIEVLCKQDEREGMRAVLWGVHDMTKNELGRLGSIFVDKPANEIKSHPLPKGRYIWLEVAGGDRVINLNTVDSPNSYLVLFQEVDKSAPPPPDPDKPEDPGRPAVPSLIGSLQVTVNQAQVASWRPDADGNVTFFVDVRSVDA